MSEKCGFKWLAPTLHPVKVECYLPKGHKGDHMSWVKATAPNSTSRT